MSSTERSTTTEAPASPMPRLTVGVGGLLILIGIVAYVATDFASATALIPSALGVLLTISGLIARKNTKVGVHIALVLALLGVLSMFMPLSNIGDLFAGEAENPGAVIAAAITVIVLVLYIALGVRSFVSARRWRDAAAS